MRISTTRTLRIVAGGLALVAVGTVSCNDTPTAPQSVETGIGLPGTARFDVVGSGPSVVISQVYGGGGNAGATIKNDFIELHNRSAQPVSIAGWSVQYASAAGITWAVTAISGTIQPGAYYLVQESAGTGGTALSGPDAIGTIMMGATAGKVTLVASTTALTGACPTGFVDMVSFGATASNCGSQTTATLTNSTAALRLDGGCTFTADQSKDFSTGPAAPRNSATAAYTCTGVGPQIGPLDHITITGATAAVLGGTIQFGATGFDKDGTALSPQPAIGWTTTDATIVDVNQTTGAATAAGIGQATITATSGSITATTVVTVSAPADVRGKVVISQVYGGGGNANATLKNDFVELFNPGTEAVSLTGWSVQYTSANTDAWKVTPLSGTIPAGGYYLVQEAAGAGGTVNLPVAEVTGSIEMGATAGRVALLGTVAPLPAASPAVCPTTAAGLADLVAYGSTACGDPTTFDAPTLTNTTAALRLSGGCLFTGVPKADFISAAPSPRNGATAPRSCVVGPLSEVAIAGPASVGSGFTAQFTATPQDANGNLVTNATLTWESSDPTAATVDATGKVTGLGGITTTVTITATAVSNGITKTASQQLAVTAPGIGFVDVSSSSSSFPPGFQTQVFFTARASQNGTIVPATFTFESLDSAVATMANVANTGLVTAVAPPADGTTKPGFRVTATPNGGGAAYSFIAHPISVEVPVSAPVTVYGTNDEFGDPTAAAASNPNDFLIVRTQYTLSYNQSRGTPNWVSYELDSRQLLSGQDRCNCFSADPMLPADKQILTSDYTNGGFDRGHMAPSADRILANVDNASTFYLTNIVPQKADLNQGVWAQFENALRDSVRTGRAVYIITGPLYSRSHGLTFVKNEGKIAIPDSTWKVAFIGPKSGGLPFDRTTMGAWGSLAGTTVLAVNMPNVAGVRNNPWAMYLTTVDRIEAATGYDFLSLLPTAFQDAIEAGDHAPTARFTKSGTLEEGSTLSFDASASSDPDLGSTTLSRTDALTYSWSFGDGTSATGATPSKTYMKDGTYTATLTVTDAYGWEATTTSPLTIANVTPQIAAFNGATILQGETYSAPGTFTDPGDDTWTATVSYGDGSGEQPAAVSGRSFALSHMYAGAGSFTVTVTVNDGLATTTRSATVVVETPLQGVDNLSAMLAALGNGGTIAPSTQSLPQATNESGTIGKGELGSLQAKLNAASAQLRRGNGSAPSHVLDAFVNELQAMVNSGRLSESAASPLIAYASRVSASAAR